MLTENECKKILSKLGFKLGVSPKLITTRLLDDQDKGNMLTGVLEIVELESHISVWRDNGFPDYRHGFTEPMKNSLYPVSSTGK